MRTALDMGDRDRETVLFALQDAATVLEEMRLHGRAVQTRAQRVRIKDAHDKVKEALGVMGRRGPL